MTKRIHILLSLSLTYMFVIFAPLVFATSGEVQVIKLVGIIDPVAVEYITSGINNAAAAGATCLVLEMDTPGGLDSSMRKICQAIFDSPIPVVVYVYPTGARAASAGVFITMSAHIAAMAPGTNIGAAHPVDASGNMVSEKITNDAAATARSYALKTHRNVEWAEQAVVKSVSITYQEAVDKKVVDLIATDLNDLLKQINGRKVKLKNTEVTLETLNVTTRNIPMSWRQDFLHTLSNPNIAYIFMLLGIMGLIYELSNPHGLSGVAGVICILLALVSAEALPFSLAGLLLILFAIILFIIDIKAPTHGVLTSGGIISLVMGSLFLFSPSHSPQAPYISVQVSWITIIVMTLITTSFFVFVVTKGLQAMKKPFATGVHLLQGAEGLATTDIQPDGVVHVQGEEWKAINESSIKIIKGDKIRITKIDGLTVHVEKV